MTQKDSLKNTPDNILYLIGFNDALLLLYKKRNLSVASALSEIQDEEYKYALKTAVQIINGGALNPIDVFNMDGYVEKLAETVYVESKDI